MRCRQPKFWLTSRWQVPVATAPAVTSADARHWPLQAAQRLQRTARDR